MNMKKLSKKKRRKRILTSAAVLIVLAVSLVVTSLMGIVELPFEITAWKDVFDLVHIDTVTDLPDSDFSVTFLDVGQGDCSLIRSGGKTMLIDGGEPENADKIINFLKENSITKLDYVVATHPHSDHIGALPSVIDAMEVENVIIPELPENMVPTTKIYEEFLFAVEKSGANLISAWSGDEFSLADAKCQVLSPVVESEELNNMSLVIRMTFGNNSFLFMGDAEIKAEDILLSVYHDVSADVIKIGHHGSSTSTNEKFLNIVSPQIAVICVGEDNRYDHPSKETVELLEEYGVKTYMTKDNGDIVITSDGNKLSVKCQKGD